MSRKSAAPIAQRRAQSEFALIDAFLKPFGIARDGANFGSRSGVILGPGDDCAQLQTTRGTKLIATTDAALDGVHFDLRRSPPEDAGWKALAINLSDLAAAGAKPRWFLCALGVPKNAADPNSVAAAFARGMAKLAKQSGCALAGGNVTRALQWSLTITALGESKKPMSRRGGKPGDQLFLVGELGAAALGLQLLMNQQPSRKPALGAGERAAIRAQLHPEPQLEAGLLAARFASCAIDISDGLLQDLAHLCKRSRCGANIDCDQLPRSAAVKAAEKNLPHPYELSLSGGEDYALLVAVPPKHTGRFQKILPQAKRIGQLTAKENQIDLFDRDRAIPHPARPGYDHLK